jgi:nitroreductase
MLEIMRKRRTIRIYQDKDVSDSLIQELLKAAFFSPSSKNLRPWHFIIVKDSEMRRKLSEATPWSRPAERAPVVIIVLAEELSEKWIEDCAIAAEHIQLAATELGLGACWLQIRGNMHGDEPAEDYVKRLLNIPDNFRVECMVSVGYPAEEKEPHSESKVRWDRVYAEKFGVRWKE